MRDKGVMAMMYGACEAIMKIAWLNGIWVLFTLGGGIVFGWAPSTAAMFTVVRKWLLGRTDAPLFKTFYQTYKKEFFKANGLGLILITAGTILFVNYQFFRVLNSRRIYRAARGLAMSAAAEFCGYIGNIGIPV